MAGSTFLNRLGKISSLLIVVFPLLALSGCFGEGDGPTVIPATPVTPEVPPTDGGGEAFDSGLLINGDFEAGVSPWIGNAANVVDDGGNAVNSADIAVAGDAFNVNLSQVLTITEGETYTLTFKARSNRTRTMLAGIGLNEEPFTNTTETVNLTTQWQTFVFNFTATGFGNANSRVLFDMGADTGLVLIDDVSLFAASGGGAAGTPIDPDSALYRTGGAPDLVIPTDYAESTPFGSGSIIDPFYADDDTYSPVLSVFSGTNYGANIAQVGFIGFPAGFLGAYETVDFKVKGMPNFVIFVKLFDGVDTLRINLTSSNFSELLVDGWYQVSIPLSRFSGAEQATGIVLESDNTAAMQFRMLLTDVGFSGTGGGTGGGTASGGEIPEVVIYAADGSPADLSPTYTPFGSGSSFETIVDSSYANAFEITVGAGYGGGALAQLGLSDLGAGFATGYDEFLFKVKGLTADNTILVKLEAGGGGTVTLDLTAPPANVAVTDLGDGWSQVVIQMAAFGDVSTSSQIVFQTLDGAYAQGATFLLTDIGFNNAGGGGGGGGGTAMGGEVPEASIYAADGSAADLSPTYTPFGSGSTFATIADSSYANAFEITVGAGYGGGALAQLGLSDLGAGFATGYDEFLFKVKGLTADNTILVKFEATGGGTVTIDLTAPPTNVAVTDLGDGWLQVVIQMVAFGDISNASQIVFQTLDGAYAQGDTFLLTDIGFNNAGGGTAMGGEVPEVVIYAADGSAADLSPTYTPFGSGSTFATIADSSYANAFEITVGAGYGGGALAQLGLSDLGAGFATGYDEFLFKVKGLTADNTILVKFEATGGGTVTIDLTAPPTNVAVTDLGDGWLQVVIQMVAFGDISNASQIVFQTLDGAYAQGDTFLLTDIGFNNAGGGTAMGGEVPEVVIYAADGSAADLSPTYTPFGSGSTFATIADSSYANAFEITVGAGYGGGALAQLGLSDLGAGFATGYDEFLFKVKGLTADNTILVKFEATGGGTVTIDLTAPPTNVAVTDLGDGWLQVVIQMVAFGDISNASQIVFQTLDGAYAQGDTFLLTDIGFNNAGGGTAMGGEVPEVVIYAADGSAADLSPTYTPFGSGSTFATIADSSYANAFEITVGAGYGGGALAQLGLSDLGAGFATGYDEFLFKVKGLTADNTILVKFEATGGGTVTIDLTAPPTNVAVTDLGDGWLQVVIQMVAFGDISNASQIVFQTLDGAYAQGDTFLLTDIGFNNAGGGTAMGGEVPEVVIYAADGSAADLSPTYTPFGSGSTFATIADSSYANAFEITVGAGYGGGALAQLGLSDLGAGFATGYDEFLFKVKGLTADNTILVKFEATGGGTVTIDLTAPPTNVAVTDLGDGWLQVVIQMVAFGDISNASQIVFQTLDGAYAQGDTFLLTDIGFNNAGGGTAMGGEVPEVVIYAADGSAADLSPTYTPFGSGSTFATIADSSYANAFEITVGAGYGGGALAQLGLSDLGAGFATGYDEFLFKVKGLTADNTILVKFEATGGGTVTIDLTAPPTNVAVTDLGDGWLQVVIQMVAFGDISNASQIVFQTLDGAYAQGDTFLLTDIGFNNASVNIAVNGDFETGAFNDGSPNASWQQFPGAGTQMITTDNPSAGTFAAHLSIPVRGATDPGVDNLIKNANLEAGNLTANSSITVDFDMRGAFIGDSGVVFAELFSEISGGGTSKAEILGGGAPLTPNTTWTPYSFTTTLGPDVSGGVTLQLKVGCGAVEGCGADVFFDNVSITLN